MDLDSLTLTLRIVVRRLIIYQLTNLVSDMGPTKLRQALDLRVTSVLPDVRSSIELMEEQT